MPTYDYVCRHCEHAFEQFQSITAGPLRKCPACGKMQLKRLIGPGAGVIFKGSGFYETDYRSPSYEKQAKAEREGAGGGGDAGTSGAPAKGGGDTGAATGAGEGGAKPESAGTNGNKGSQAGSGSNAGGSEG